MATKPTIVKFPSLTNIHKTLQTTKKVLENAENLHSNIEGTDINNQNRLYEVT